MWYRFDVHSGAVRHKSSKTTEVYTIHTYITIEDLGRIKSPLDLMSMRGDAEK